MPPLEMRRFAGLFNLAWRAPATLFTPPRQFRPLAHSGWGVTGARAAPIVEMPKVEMPIVEIKAARPAAFAPMMK